MMDRQPTMSYDLEASGENHMHPAVYTQSTHLFTCPVWTGKPCTCGTPIDPDLGSEPPRAAARAKLESLEKLSYSVREATAALGISRATLYRLFAAGKIPTVKIGCKTVILRSALEAFLAKTPAGYVLDDPAPSPDALEYEAPSDWEPYPWPKPWIDWLGGECPVGVGVVVEYRLRSGQILQEKAGGLLWGHTGRTSDIVAYRVADTADPVNHPAHYKAHGVECIQITEHMNFCRGNAVKYLFRAGKKGDELEDLRKARWYVDREIARLEQAAHDAKFGEGRD